VFFIELIALLDYKYHFSITPIASLNKNEKSNEKSNENAHIMYNV